MICPCRWKHRPWHDVSSKPSTSAATCSNMQLPPGASRCWQDDHMWFSTRPHRGHDFLPKFLATPPHELSAISFSAPESTARAVEPHHFPSNPTLCSPPQINSHTPPRWHPQYSLHPSTLNLSVLTPSAEVCYPPAAYTTRCYRSGLESGSPTPYETHGAKCKDWLLLLYCTALSGWRDNRSHVSSRKAQDSRLHRSGIWANRRETDKCSSNRAALLCCQ
jgi:hypothetical protein